MKKLARRVINQSQADLRARIASLEEEVQECRELNRRVAELTDVVTEVLAGVASDDQARVRKALEAYEAGL